MTFRLSLRKKLVYTFLGGSLLTVLLFSIVIKEITRLNLAIEGESKDHAVQIGDISALTRTIDQVMQEVAEGAVLTNVANTKVEDLASALRQLIRRFEV